MTTHEREAALDTSIPLAQPPVEMLARLKNDQTSNSAHAETFTQVALTEVKQQLEAAQVARRWPDVEKHLLQALVILRDFYPIAPSLEEAVKRGDYWGEAKSLDKPQLQALRQFRDALSVFVQLFGAKLYTGFPSHEAISDSQSAQFSQENQRLVEHYLVVAHGVVSHLVVWMETEFKGLAPRLKAIIEKGTLTQAERAYRHILAACKETFLSTDSEADLISMSVTLARRAIEVKNLGLTRLCLGEIVKRFSRSNLKWSTTLKIISEFSESLKVTTQPVSFTRWRRQAKHSHDLRLGLAQVLSADYIGNGYGAASPLLEVKRLVTIHDYQALVHSAQFQELYQKWLLVEKLDGQLAAESCSPDRLFYDILRAGYHQNPAVKKIHRLFELGIPVITSELEKTYTYLLANSQN